MCRGIAWVCDFSFEYDYVIILKTPGAFSHRRTFFPKTFSRLFLLRSYASTSNPLNHNSAATVTSEVTSRTVSSLQPTNTCVHAQQSNVHTYFPYAPTAAFTIKLIMSIVNAYDVVHMRVIGSSSVGGEGAKQRPSAITMTLMHTLSPTASATSQHFSNITKRSFS